jgi:hypothetical protein
VAVLDEPVGELADVGDERPVVRLLADRLVEDGHVTKKQRPVLISAAARSDVGR